MDVAVVEAGLGGIRDATNVFTSKQLMLAIVTTLGLEHQAALGMHTLAPPPPPLPFPFPFPFLSLAGPQEAFPFISFHDTQDIELASVPHGYHEICSEGFKGNRIRDASMSV